MKTPITLKLEPELLTRLDQLINRLNAPTDIPGKVNRTELITIAIQMYLDKFESIK